MPIGWNSSPSVAPPGCFLWGIIGLVVVEVGAIAFFLTVFVLETIGAIPRAACNG